MYNNIGGKIKGLAKASFLVESLGAVVAGIVLMASSKDLILIGILTMLLGPIVAWCSSWVLYGFGEIIDKLCEIERNTKPAAMTSETKKSSTRQEVKTKKAETVKQEVKYDIKKQTETISEEENGLIVKCPDCGEELFFDKDVSYAECPFCGCNVKINK